MWMVKAVVPIQTTLEDKYTRKKEKIKCNSFLSWSYLFQRLSGLLLIFQLNSSIWTSFFFNFWWIFTHFVEIAIDCSRLIWIQKNGTVLQHLFIRYQERSTIDLAYIMLWQRLAKHCHRWVHWSHMESVKRNNSLTEGKLIK